MIQWHNNSKTGVFMLKKNISKIGNSWGVIIPRAIFELVNINPIRDEVSIEVEADTIKIKKVKKDQ